MTGLSDGNNKQQSQFSLGQASSTAVQGRATEHMAASTSVQRIQMEVGGGPGQSERQEQCWAKGQQTDESRQRRVWGQGSQIKPWDYEVNVHRACSNCWQRASETARLQIPPSHTELWPLLLDVPIQTTSLQPSSRMCGNNFLLMGPFLRLRLSKWPVLPQSSCTASQKLPHSWLLHLSALKSEEST